MALPEIRTRIRVLCQEEVISLQSSAQAEALRPDSCVQDRGTRKIGWDRLKGGVRQTTESLVPYPVGAPWPVVHVRRRPGTNESQSRLLGQIRWQASWSWSTPSGLDVSPSKNGGVPSWSPVVVGMGGPLQGPKTGLLSNTWKRIVQGDTC